MLLREVGVRICLLDLKYVSQRYLTLTGASDIA